MLTMNRGVGLIVAVALIVIAMLGWGTVAADGGTLHQVMRPDGVGLVLTATDVAPTGPLEAFDVGFWMITANFNGVAEAKGNETTVVVVANDRVTSLASGTGASIPSIAGVPEGGYILIGSGVAAKFLSGFGVGDAVGIVSKQRRAPDPTPTTVITLDGAHRSISALNRGRRADELIVYTPDFGTHSLSNEWGIEVAVADGVVVARRGYQDPGLFAIPANGFVISGHGTANAWVDANLRVGTVVQLSE